MGCFPFTKNAGLSRKFGNSTPNGTVHRTVHSSYTDRTQATARLVIVLVRRMQKSGTGDYNFVKWKGAFWSN